jgi:type II secretory pathway pseudopilin PulG
MHHSYRQRGISFIGLLFVAGLLAVTVVIAMQVVPTAIEYFAVQKAVQRASTAQTALEARELFNRQAEVDSIKSISGKDIDVSTQGEKLVVAFAYQREIHLVGPAFLTLKYAGRSN